MLPDGTTTPPAAAPRPTSGAGTVDVVIPVYNEEKILAQSIDTLVGFLREHVRLPCRVLIVDNASIDRTEEEGRRLSGNYAEVAYLRLPRKGRGGALMCAWSASTADFLTYMDVDLSTNLAALPKMIDLLASGYPLVIGSRLRSGAQTKRSLKREFLSRGYNLLVRLIFRTRFTDAQCGFKGLRREAALRLLPHVSDNRWFFDTELLVLAERSGHPIGEVAVQWIEDLDSRVALLTTIVGDILGLLRLRRELDRKLALIGPFGGSAGGTAGRPA